MAKVTPGKFDRFQGLWARGHKDNTPPDHFQDCLNLEFKNGVSSRGFVSQSYPGVTTFDNSDLELVRTALYKPDPPFTGINIPRIIGLKSNGELHDILKPIGTSLLHTDANARDFALVNFFGRCYISFHDGKVGLQNKNIYVYDGTTFREAGPGAPPSVAPSGTQQASTGTLGLGIYIFAYAWETASGAITRPSPFLDLDFRSYPNGTAQLTGIANGPAGTVAKWLICNKVIPYPTEYSGNPFDYPLYFAHRIDDNTTTTYDLTFYDGNLDDSADYLLTLEETIPAGVGLLDYKGRLVSYGEYDDPSTLRASHPGEPEAFSETSGFLITEPSDNTGIRSATEFRGTLYFFKRQRGYITQDNGEEASTWEVINFEKAVGTEQHGIADILDAKGSSSDGFLLGSLAGLFYFDGVFRDIPLTFKVQDYWLRINQNFFHKIQVANDPINKRIYILLPLDNNEDCNYILFGDYRDGLTPGTIKWCPWQMPSSPRSMLIYTDFTDNIPNLVNRLALTNDLVDVNLANNENDADVDGEYQINSHMKFAPVRFSDGVSVFYSLMFRGQGPATFTIQAYGQDDSLVRTVSPITIESELAGREYQRPFNLVSEMCSIKISHGVIDEYFNIQKVILEGKELWKTRAR